MFPQHEGPQTAIKSLSVVEIIFFHSFGLGRSYPSVQERSENQKVDSSQSSLKNANLTKETPIRKTIMKICVKYTTSDLGTLELQNHLDRLSW